MKHTVAEFQKMKESGQKIAMLTAYDYSTAKVMDEAGIHGILVGDSLGMVMLGYENTLSVTMEDMIHHGRAAARGVKEALLVIDMPFMSYETSVRDAVINAGRLIKETGGHAVKLEGGAEVCPQIKAITAAKIPVMAHIGMTPQAVHAFGGFKVQGKEKEAAAKILEAAKSVEEAGAFAIVLECVPEALGKAITKAVSVPTIGIGAGAACDGQILVFQDMLGMYNDFKPKFVKQYASLSDTMKSAYQTYIREVQEQVFPSSEFSFL
ncbi:3-methyl-2-oxobutanoate hydroxymethyltransferase [Anaeromicropila populeti]|uniref:3-methyl-2-oxobutanoate hydroxymethyltransferase n=1 Tax=Anaeromicropila populeti TaxID=37658 RepID=A0A1I6JQ75_9FIRM|nr:3-methyl-2-oxobutanoate hydroxymethyltransferase [Anaeromicropila populeti]SFR81093.1 ketopantoate hydroxymethyltransferase [Anaeromicropila populeti]